ncbi:MAG TPA: YbaK/EbsC family protein [Candidatus Saccharimonadales bacterium]|jgi:Ala-tRNA(Pro) deacylase|nr:YbaK/EbsC family protein [Candidatus Saccharimonadales bacterium]
MNPYLEIKKLLTDNNIIYEEIEHEPVFTSEQAAKVRGLSPDEGAKSLLLKSSSDFILAILPGNKKLDSKKLKNLIKTKNIRFASPEEVEAVMHCKIGSCYPFGNIIKVITIADSSMAALGNMSFNPGVHDKSIKIKWSDYNSLVNPYLSDISAD